MTHSITSTKNPRILTAVRLRDRRGRDDQQRIVIDGAREISRALQAKIVIREIFVVDTDRSDQDADVLSQAERGGAEVFAVSRAVMAKLAYGDRDSGLVATADLPHRALSDVNLPTDPVVAVLEGVEKPGNIGAVVRTADSARVSAVIVASGGTDLFNPNAIRASAGTVFTVPVVAASSREVLDWLQEHQFHILAARVGAPQCYWDANFRGRVAIAMGSESAGLSEQWNQPAIESISLPQHGVADSLNVSVTAAVLFYESLRQRSGQ